MVAQSQPLSNIQLELLKLYTTNLSDSQLLDIQHLLSEYFSNLIDRDMSALWEEKKWDSQTIQQWKQERLRTPYK